MSDVLWALMWWMDGPVVPNVLWLNEWMNEWTY